jgi:hypothetical protein
LQRTSSLHITDYYLQRYVTIAGTDREVQVELCCHKFACVVGSCHVLALFVTFRTHYKFFFWILGKILGALGKTRHKTARQRYMKVRDLTVAR